jgi:hypothetical protein
MEVAKRGEQGVNIGRARGRLPRDARRGRIHDSAGGGGGYGVLGEGRVRARGWQAGPTGQRECGRARLR